ncbi:MAG TPA: glycosyltransferase [Thermoanaerobaculia bacterium]
MKGRGLVSTIIPVFNRPAMVTEAVAGVLNQTYSDVEVIVVDDGSTDETWKTCQRLALRDKRVKIRRIEHVGRPGLVREVGRVLARGEYIQYLDSDDLIPPERFARMIETLNEREPADLAYCLTRRYSLGQQPEWRPAGRTGETHTRIFPEILSERPWFSSSVLYRRAICDRAGPWSDLPFMEDVELDARIGRFGATVRHCPEFLADMRDHSGERVSRQDLLERTDLLKDAVRAYSMIFSHARAAGVTATEIPMILFLEEVRLLASRAGKLLLPEESSTCAQIIETAFGPTANAGLTLDAEIEPVRTDLTLKAGATTTCPVRIRNRSAISFREGRWPVHLSYHLLSPSGDLLQFDNRRTPFQQILWPGEKRIVDLQIEAPNFPGDYVLRIDLVLERVSWFEWEGVRPGIVHLRVEDATGVEPAAVDG